MLFLGMNVSLSDADGTKACMTAGDEFELETVTEWHVEDYIIIVQDKEFGIGPLTYLNIINQSRPV